MFGTEVETIQSGGEEQAGEQAVNEEAKHNLAVKFHPTYSIQFGNQSGWQIPECYSQECSDYVIGGEIRAITKYRSAPREKHSDEWRPNVRPCLGQRDQRTGIKASPTVSTSRIGVCPTDGYQLIEC